MTCTTPTLEVCCADLTSLNAAINGGAGRIELCQALQLDGLTPSAGMMEAAMASGIRTHVLIRPREGGFVYSEQEVECMLRDIRLARNMGIHGVVIGALTPSGDIDETACHELADEAVGMSITFHRAFDVCRNPMEALHTIHSLGCDRILTSGQAPTAYEGIPLLKALVKEAETLSANSGRHISIMPGCGVTAENVVRILSRTGAREIHGSLRKDGHTDAETVRTVINRIRHINRESTGTT